MHWRKCGTRLLTLIAAAALFVSGAVAAPYIVNGSLYLGADQIAGSNSVTGIEDNIPAAGPFTLAGMTTTLTPTFDPVSGALTQFRWTVLNDSGVDYTNTLFVGYLNANTEEPLGVVFDTSDTVSFPGLWQIDRNGALQTQLDDGGPLDNTNHLLSGSSLLPGDVELGIGFAFPLFPVGSLLNATFTVTEGLSDGLYVFNFLDDSLEFSYNGVAVADIAATPVPEPGTMLLLTTGLLGVLFGARKRFHRV